MIVWKISAYSGSKYWSAGGGNAFTGVEPFIGFLEELPTFVQNAIAILHIAGERNPIEGIGIWVGDKYSVVLPKETS